MKTAVIYWSGTGNTETMANAVAEGMKEAGAEVTMLTPEQVQPAALSGFGAIALGCPAMGSEVLEEMDFQPMFDGCKNAIGSKRLRLGRRPVDARLGQGLRQRRNLSGLRQRHLLRSAGRRGAGRLPRVGQGAGRLIHPFLRSSLSPI